MRVCLFAPATTSTTLLATPLFFAQKIKCICQNGKNGIKIGVNGVVSNADIDGMGMVAYPVLKLMLSCIPKPASEYLTRIVDTQLLLLLPYSLLSASQAFFFPSSVRFESHRELRFRRLARLRLPFL